MDKDRRVKDHGRPQSENQPADRAVRLPVGVVVERREARSKWAEHIWVPVAVMPGRAALDPGTEMTRGEAGVRYYLGSGEIDLHRSEAEAYHFNLASTEPALFVVLRAQRPDPLPWRLQDITASPYHAQDYLDAAEDIVERVPFPDVILHQVTSFVDLHYKEEPFRKRRRDRVETENLQFGKEPVFLNPKQKQRGEWNG